MKQAAWHRFATQGSGRIALQGPMSNPISNKEKGRDAIAWCSGERLHFLCRASLWGEELGCLHSGPVALDLAHHSSQDVRR